MRLILLLILVAASAPEAAAQSEPESCEFRIVDWNASASAWNLGNEIQVATDVVGLIGQHSANVATLQEIDVVSLALIEALLPGWDCQGAPSGDDLIAICVDGAIANFSYTHLTGDLDKVDPTPPPVSWWGYAQAEYKSVLLTSVHTRSFWRSHHRAELHDQVKTGIVAGDFNHTCPIALDIAHLDDCPNVSLWHQTDLDQEWTWEGDPDGEEGPLTFGRIKIDHVVTAEPPWSVSGDAVTNKFGSNHRPVLAEVVLPDHDDDGICGESDNCPDHSNPNQFDSDHDEVGDGCDNCAGVANPGQENGDGDPFGDACDHCPNHASTDQFDIDHDQVYDACDPDRDEDGCSNEPGEPNQDQHPDSSVAVTGHLMFSPVCSGNPDPRSYSPEGGVHTDDDRVPDCADYDDDDDGACDDNETLPPGTLGAPFGCVGPDPCPLIKDAPASLCTQFVDCPQQNPWFLLCELSPDCFAFFTKLVEVVNPDPTRAQFEHISIVGRSLYLFPGAGETLQEAGEALLQGAGAGDVAAAASGPGDGMLRLELWRKADPDTGAAERFVALVAEYHPSDVALGDLSRGTVLRVDPSDPFDPTGVSLAVGGVWTPGQVPGDELPDADRDRVPDPLDVCRATPDPAQIDTNGDRIGNACDLDYDGDGRVGLPDFNRLRRSFGLRCIERGFDVDVDADGDCSIGFGEFTGLRDLFGGAPGPSGQICPRGTPCQ